MPEEPVVKKPRGRVWKWLKRGLLTLLVLFLLLAAFHRPIFFRLTRYFIIRAAEQQNLDLKYEMNGSIFTSLRILNLRATPTEPGPIKKLVIERLALRYSLWGLIRKGLPGFLDEVELAGVDIELNPSEERPKEPQEKQKVKFPALFPRRLVIADFSLIAHDAKGTDLVVKHLFLSLEPETTGELKIERLAIPRVHDWSAIAAETTYRDRNLVLSGMSLGPELFMRRFSLDASRLNDGVLSVGLEGTMFSGRAKLEARISDLNETNRMDVTADVSGIEFAEAVEYLKLEVKLGGRLSELHGRFEGVPTEPRAWTTELRVAVDGLAVAGVTVDAIKLGADLEKGSGTVRIERMAIGENVLVLQADINLPEKMERMAFLDATGKLKLDAPSLGAVTIPGMELGGSLEAVGPFAVHDGVVSGEFVVNGENLRLPEVKVKSLENTDFTFKKRFAEDRGAHAFRVRSPAMDATSDYIRVANKTAAPEANKQSPLEALEFSLSGKATGVEAKGYEADAVTFDVTGKDGKIEVKKAEITKGENTVSAEGTYTVPDDPAEIDLAQADFKVNVSAPQLKDFVVAETGKQLEGALEIDGDVRRVNGKLNGKLNVQGSGLAFSGLEARSLAAEIEIRENVAHIESLKLIFDDRNEIAALGEVALAGEMHYAGAVEATLNDLSIFEPLLEKKDEQMPAEDDAALERLGETEKPEPQLAGAVSLNWAGEGNLKPQDHQGELQFGAKDVNLNGTVVSRAKLEGKYTTELMEFPVFEVVLGETALAATIEAEAGKLRIKGIDLKQGKQQVLSGFVFLPFHPEALGDVKKLMPIDERIAVNLTGTKIDIPKLLATVGNKPAPVTGTVSLRLTAGGTLDAPVGNLFVEGREVKATAQPKLKPATLDLHANYKPGALALDATINQGDIKPITVKGTVPLDLQALAKGEQLAPNLPVDLSVKMPSSSLAFVSELTPAVRYLEGTLGINVAVTGTVGQPDFSGSATLDLPAIRMKSAAAPAINDFKGELAFVKNTLTIERFGGVISGGPFNLQGKMIFETLTEPALDLRLAARNALLVRNSSVTVRADADVRINGPFKTARVSGQVGLVNSRFYREVDILPLQLPGKPAPGVPSPTRGVSFPMPPLRDWKFDVAIVTKEPFKIRGNLANGAAFADLKLVGTGLEPALDGSVRMENFVASLPFSKLEITRGYVYFSPDDPFTPVLDIQGDTTMRNYDLSVYIYGTANDPQTLFSSQPPLPQEDIIALIGTGTTTAELASGGDALAGRGAVLLFQKLYRSVFKAKEPTEDESFLDRFEVSVGGVDPQTGQQEATAKFKVGENFYLIGEVGIGGSVTGKMSYLVRFR